MSPVRKTKAFLKIGKLDEWTKLKRSIISSGILLYGKYKESPKELIPYIIFCINYGDLVRKNKVKLWRKIYGYRQRVGRKIYSIKGLAKLKLGSGCIIAEIKDKNKIIDILKKYKINYRIYEIWSDVI